MGLRICVCGVQVPFAYGGAEILVASLADELKRRGHTVDVVSLPFTWPNRVQLFKSCMAWRMLDLSEVDGQRIDRVIATRFPSYVVKHPDKVVWLVHQLRQAYDLRGTGYSDFTVEGRGDRDARVVEMLRSMDERTLGEARRVYAISDNVAARLERHNNMKIGTLYPPPRLIDRLAPGEMGDYVFTAGRLNRIKRFDLLIRAMKHTKTPVRCRIAGTGEEREALEKLIADLRLEDRVELLGWIDDDRAVALYSGALAVFYAPYDEDYGYVTVEACRSAKPVITVADSGGVLEWVADGKTGYVVAPDDPAAIAARLDALYADRALARRLGEAGAEKARDVSWDQVIDGLLG
ncbi:MAG: glycosyltransferase family 4 protein [Acidobacteriota bacterium]